MNCSYDSTASVGQFIRKSYNLLNEYFRHLDHNENEVKTWFPMRIDAIDYLAIVLLIFIWKCTREFFMKNISKPCIRHLNIADRHSKRSEESIWDFVNDVAFWMYVLMLSLANDHQCNLYLTPSQLFDSKLSRYSFGIYSVLYLDEKKKDFPIMVMHHIVTLVLITIGYVSRVFKSSLIVILIHNVCNMFLNCSKVLLSSRPKSAAGNSLKKIVLNINVVLFTFTWFINRLYLYPLRAIYYLSFFSVKSPEGRIFGIAYLLLLLIFLMDLFWTWYVAKFLWRTFVHRSQFFDPISEEAGENVKTMPQTHQTNSSDIKYKKLH